jgi:hypothetical protein
LVSNATKGYRYRIPKGPYLASKNILLANGIDSINMGQIFFLEPLISNSIVEGFWFCSWGFYFEQRVGVPYLKFHGLPISLGTLHRNKWNWKSVATWIHCSQWKFVCVHMEILCVNTYSFHFHVFPCKVPKEIGRLWNLKSNSYTCVYGQYRIIACMDHWARTYLPCAQLSQFQTWCLE